MRSSPNLPDIFLNQIEYRIQSLMKNIYHTSRTCSIKLIYLTGRIIRIIKVETCYKGACDILKRIRYFVYDLYYVVNFFKLKLNLNIHLI